MRRVSSWAVWMVILLVVSPVAAEERSAPAELDALKAQVAGLQAQVRELREVLRQQAATLAVLKRRQAEASSADASEPAAASPQANGALDQQASLAERVQKLEESAAYLSADTAENQEPGEGLLKKRLSNFSFSGDLRVRYEPFFQDGSPQRHRERARFRFQARARITDELSGGFRLATGNLSDPITTNQTFTGFFTRKTFNLDRFWLSYEPERVPWLSFTAGKFAYPWYRTELTFDSDLNPEGFTETLSFDFSDSPLTNLTVVGFQLPFNELSRAGDSFIWGGQVQTHWKLTDRARLGLYAAGLNFRNADAIARAIGEGALDPSLPLTNTVDTDAQGNILGFTEPFTYLDLIAELKYRLRPQWPLRLTFDFVNNVRAGSAERSAYWAEVALGETAEKGDWLFGYTLMRVEKDAVIGAFRFSDSRASTNVLNHRVRAGYQVHNNVTLDYTLLVGRLFNPQDNLNLVPAAFQPRAEDPFLTRMQFDVIYKF